MIADARQRGFFDFAFQKRWDDAGLYDLVVNTEKMTDEAAAAVIVALVLLGQVLELRARGRTSAAIRLLLGLAPATAARLVRLANKALGQHGG